MDILTELPVYPAYYSPKCSCCQFAMFLSLIEPLHLGWEARTFHCPTCGTKETLRCRVTEQSSQT